MQLWRYAGVGEHGKQKDKNSWNVEFRESATYPAVSRVTTDLGRHTEYSPSSNGGDRYYVP